MDANLREMGVGDLTVPKRMQAFGEPSPAARPPTIVALAEGHEPLAQALDKNIYSGRTSRARDGLRPIRRTRSPYSPVVMALR